MAWVLCFCVATSVDMRVPQGMLSEIMFANLPGKSMERTQIFEQRRSDGNA